MREREGGREKKYLEGRLGRIGEGDTYRLKERYAYENACVRMK